VRRAEAVSSESYRGSRALTTGVETANETKQAVAVATVHDDLVGRFVRIDLFRVVVVCTYEDRSHGRVVVGRGGDGRYDQRGQPEQEDTG
jgi:hypothetical protein